MDNRKIEDEIKLLLHNLTISYSGNSTEEIKKAELVLLNYEEFIIKKTKKKEKKNLKNLFSLIH